MMKSSTARRLKFSDEEEKPKRSKKPKDSSEEDDPKPKTSKKRRNITKVEVDEEYKKLVEAIVYYMERMNYTLIAFYRRCDKNQDFHISLSEFQKTITQTVEYDIEDDMLERVYQRFAQEIGSEITFKDMEESLYRGHLLTIQNIQ